MCRSICGCLFHSLDRSKSWSIRAQMLFFCVGTLALILLLINCLAVFNLIYLESSTVAEVQSAAEALDNQNLLTSTNLIGHVMQTYLESGLMLMGSVQAALVQFLANTTIGLVPLESYEYQDLPQSCMQYNPKAYGNHPVCIINTSYIPLGTVNATLVALTAELDYLLPQLGSLSYGGSSLLRLTMYFKDYNFIRIFPGTFLPGDYAVNNTEWYMMFLSNGSQLIATSAYNDSLGSGQPILSLVSPLVDDLGKNIGAMAMDITIEAIYSGIFNMTKQRDDSSILLVARNGWSLPDQASTAWKFSQQIDLTDVVTDQQTVYTLNMNDTTRKYAGTLIPNDTNWWYALLVIDAENEPDDQYGNMESAYIREAGMWVLATTAINSVLVLASVSICICAYSDRLTSPLTGVVDFAQSLHNSATNHTVDVERLEELEEGEDNVQALVRNFKKLVKRLVNKPVSGRAMRFSLVEKKFPRNNLHDGEAITWRATFRRL